MQPVFESGCACFSEDTGSDQSRRAFRIRRFCLYPPELHESGDNPRVAWLTACVEANGGKDFEVGAYVSASGDVFFDDHLGWSIDIDLETLGIDPRSPDGQRIIADWAECARWHGLDTLNSFFPLLS
ncbi:hypothetical protein HW932_20005 [Allochromatium humboldtianum]|uniref:Uncharacterized protein n=1 Tax=Allochromatium humboldtianum TaxID=504901 RepID=A0A850RDW4_9GAMM|nr:hypothetical protein [Allochromatium humboldtianum]NVZ11538.1 hypothetical protein [Allochromatium humboldtianum]